MTTDSPQRSPQGSARPLQQDRREFLKLAAAIPTALAATQARGADAPADKAKPADTTPMPQIQLGKYSISRLIVGCHNIDGGSHMSPFLDKEMHDYYTPERAVQIHARAGRPDVATLRGGRHQHLARTRTGHAAGDLQPSSEVGRQDVPVGTHRFGRGHPTVCQDRRADRHGSSRGSYRRPVQGRTAIKYQVFLRFRKPSSK